MVKSNEVDVIVVGAGYGGLAAAIELTRKGCNVKVFESVKKLSNQGDIIQIASNATKIVAKWGDTLHKIEETSAAPAVMRCQNKDGELLIEQDLPTHYVGAPNVYSNRGLAQKFIYEYALSIGVQFHFGTRITKFFENEDSAGIYVGDEKFQADTVIFADGVHSRGRHFVTGIESKPMGSGFAVYRSWFPMERLEGEPLLKEVIESKEDLFRVWIGRDTHAILVTNTKTRHVVCFCTHKDTFTVEESWNFPGKVPDMLKAVDGWDESLKAIIRCIPPEVLIDWKLLWRDPLRQWVSGHGRMVLVGDAAHPHLATSGQGGAQAIEDGATLGALLDRAGKADIPTALRAFEKLRYERTSLTQKMGWQLRHIWHQTDWDMVKANPDLLKMPQPAWLFGGDAEQYAYNNYDVVAKHLKEGAEFKNTNLPEGYVHEDWTIQEMMKIEMEAT